MDHMIDITELDRLAHLIATEGIAAAGDLARIVDAGAEAGAPSVLLAILTDRSQPEPARARAFGAIATRIANPQAATSPGDVPAPAVARHRSSRRSELLHSRASAAMAGALQLARLR